MNLRAALAIDEARRRGISLSVEPPDTVRFKAPLGAMTPDLVADLQTHKPDVIRILLGTPPPAAPAPVEPDSAGVPRHPGRRARLADRETLRLIAWFKESVPDLPREPFHLASWLHVTDPTRFFARLVVEANRYPNGDRPEGLGADLVLLKATVDARKARGRSA